jgi:hypothetical protein
MSKILIAVGGAGQEIALACLRLCHMSGIEVPTVFVVDSDQGTGKAGLRTRSDDLEYCARSLRQTRDHDYVIFLRPFAENIRARQLGTLQSLFSPRGVTPPRAKDILSLLFTQNQQETNIIDGFHGNPTVGAVAVEDFMIQGEFKEHLLNRIDTLTEPNVQHFIVLAGSTTGGTGPGVIPVLSQKILAWRESLRPARRIEVSGIVQLQWFRLLRDEHVPWSQIPDVDGIRLQRNSACLVRQYDVDLAKLMDRLILVSLPKVVRRVSAGPNHQPETLHWLNVLSGWIARELLYDGQALKNLPKGNLYGYALDEHASPLTSLSFQDTDGPPISLKRALDATRVLATFGPALRRQIGHLRLDFALPKATFRFLRALRESDMAADQQIQSFLNTLCALLEIDQTTVKWFRDACASRFRPSDPNSARDEDDIENAFDITADQLTTDIRSVGKLLRKPQGLEQDFVAYLLNA